MAKKTPARTRSSKKDSADETGAPFDVTTHVLVPKHELCTEKEKQEVLARYRVAPLQLPRILFSDPAIAHLGAQEGDLIRILRKSPTAGSTVFYRIVTAE